MCRFNAALILNLFCLWVEIKCELETTTLKADRPGNSTINLDDNPVLLEEFLDHDMISDVEDIFPFDDDMFEYIFINYPIRYSTASSICKLVYFGQLAVIKTDNLAKFVAEALSETNIEMDALWVAGRRNGSLWYWYDHERPKDPISDVFVSKWFANYTDFTTNRTCLAVGRYDHVIPVFPQLDCSVKRPFVCERFRGHYSTHHGWINLPPRLYKIFTEPVNWTEAEVRCVKYDLKARLAVLNDSLSVNLLGRYLLIGRPSLENAWIGGRWINNSYQFEHENIVLSNTTIVVDHYPPWRYGKVQKPQGCLLLDRHVTNVTLFVEAQCKRLRPYICYKPDGSIPKDEYKDVFVPPWGYRLFYGRLPWDDARKKCDTYKSHTSHLIESHDVNITLSNLATIVQSGDLQIRNIWMGGHFDYNKQGWYWISNNKPINQAHVEWIKNTSYQDSVERVNLCLNLEIQSVVSKITYGTKCTFPQNYICRFTEQGLHDLQKDEQT